MNDHQSTLKQDPSYSLAPWACYNAANVYLLHKQYSQVGWFLGTTFSSNKNKNQLSGGPSFPPLHSKTFNQKKKPTIINVMCYRTQILKLSASNLNDWKFFNSRVYPFPPQIHGHTGRVVV